MASKALAFGFVATLITLIILLAAKPAQAATITVTTNADSTASGNCTLREAITAANTNAAVDQCAAGDSSVTDTISFSIPGTGVRTISPSSALPTIIEPVIIDGTTQLNDGGAPVVEVDGSGAGNGVNGLTITAGNSTVKGLAIYNFTQRGIVLETGDGNTVVGNYIGTDATGTASGKGNDNAGIETHLSSDNNTIGGTTAGQGNVISDNAIGVALRHTTGSVVQGNRIGTGKNGAPLGNFNDGVLLDSALGCQIGGTSPGAGNVIAFNGPLGFDFDNDGVEDDGAGVRVSSNADNDILRNSIFSNIGLGIDLSLNHPPDGVTPNDPGDGDGGPNGGQNFPVINSAKSTGGKTIIQGELDSAAGQTYIVQFFSSPAADPSGNGEGKTYLGQRTDVTTDASGHATFRFVYKKEIRRGWVSATATSSVEGTSEFSNARKIKKQQ